MLWHYNIVHLQLCHAAKLLYISTYFSGNVTFTNFASIPESLLYSTPGCLLSNPELADTFSSQRWYARTACFPAERSQLSNGGFILGNSFEKLPTT
jgi:hypothetical protein